MAIYYDFDKQWNYGDPAGTEEIFRSYLPAAEISADPEYRPQLLTQLARTQGLQRRFDEAHATLDEAEALLSEAAPVARIRYLLERGRAFNSSGHPDTARPLFLAAWDLGKAAGEDFFAVDAAHMVAIVEKGEEALAWNLKAIDYAEASSDERARGWLGSLLNNTAWTYHDMGQPEVALDLFQRAVAFRETVGDATTIRIAHWCVGRCLRTLGRLDEALEIMQRLEAEAARTGEPDGYTQEELGELALLMGREEEAAPHFKAAYAELSQDPWLMENEPERMARMQALGG